MAYARPLEIDQLLRGLVHSLSVRLPAPEQEERAVFFSPDEATLVAIRWIGNLGILYFVLVNSGVTGRAESERVFFFYNVNLFRADELRPNSTWTRQLSASARAHPFLFRSPMIHAQGVNRNPPTRPRRQIWVGLFTLRASWASKTVPFSCTCRC